MPLTHGRTEHPGGKGKSAFDTELLVDTMQVNFDGSFGDIQFAGNLFVRKTFGGKKHDLALTDAQHIAIRGAVSSASSFQ
jgi:hypothetical protein